MDQIKKISVIVSIYNEEQNIPILLPKLKVMLNDFQKTNQLENEIICVNDGSKDLSLIKLQEEQNNNTNIKIVNFTRNFGHEIAMTAGMNYATGDAALFMDGDMQNPPEVAKQMIESWIVKGYDIVLSKRKKYNIGFMHSILSKIFYRTLNFLSDVKFDNSYPDFRLISKKYIDRIKKIDEQERMFRGILTWIGITNHTVIEFDVPERLHGKSSYNLFSYFNLGLNGILQFSIKPLRLLTLFAIFCCIASAMYAVYVFFDHLINNKPSNGFATIIIMMILIFSVQTLVITLIGEYVGRIHMEVKKRPLYFADLISKK